MKIPFYQVDAFAKGLFSGNPAAVCLFEEWPKDELMQQIAAENNLAETAFIVPVSQGYELRWFTPTVEVDLCGHATLASAYIVFEELGHSQSYINFYTKVNGLLRVNRTGNKLAMNFPIDKVIPATPPATLLEALKIKPTETFKGISDYLLIVDDQQIIYQCTPDFQLLSQVDTRGVIISSKSDKFDFISRWFGPQVGVPEDPVTGSAHTTLAAYWSSKLKQKSLIGHQVSKRGGVIYCDVDNDRVVLSGHAILFMKGHIFLS